VYRIGKEELDEIAKLFETRKMFRANSTLREVENLEAEWAALVGVRHAVCVSGGTPALICALVGLDIGPGDEVIVPGYTFMASALAVLAVGAIPVIAEVDETLSLDPEDVERKVGPYTRAVMPVHMVGRPANLEGILSVLATKVRAGEYLRWITASQGNHLNVITVEEVCYFKADNKYTMVITPDGEALIRRPIKELAEVVDPNVFWQIHRSTLVNINAIAGVTRDYRGHLTVRLKERKETLPVSETYTHLFKQM